MIPNPVILYSMCTNKNDHMCTFEKRDFLAWIRRRHVWYLSDALQYEERLNT